MASKQRDAPLRPAPAQGAGGEPGAEPGLNLVPIPIRPPPSAYPGRFLVRRMAHALGALALAAGLALGATGEAAAEPVHALAMHGTPKHPPGFSHFPYVNPDAPRGGRLVLGQHGTFDSLNPFVIKGRAAAGLRNYVYESLLARSGDEPFTLYGLIAESIEVPPDRSFATFHLRSEARFADGRPSLRTTSSSATPS